MSDLGAIFHVKKSGVQYDAHAYTTISECPEPNLKVKFNGQQAYVKLENSGSGDVPCYVKTSAGTYQVRKQAIPTGSLRITSNITFTVPAGITVIRVGFYPSAGAANYVRVLPNSTHNLVWSTTSDDNNTYFYMDCDTHGDIEWTKNLVMLSKNVTLYWSPEINNHSTNVNCY